MSELGPVTGALEAGRSEGIAPGLSAVVLAGGGVAHASVHGEAQWEPARRPLGSGDLFDLASVTKLYVASAAARLVDRGELDLEARASEWLPELGGEKRDVTIRHLLAHASGLPPWRPFYEAVAADAVGRSAFLAPRERPGPAALVAAFLRGREIVEAALASEALDAPPGTRAVYSDVGFVALGVLLERRAGVLLERLVAKEVLEPLQLERTFFVPGLDPARAEVLRAGRAAQAYRR